MKVPATFRYTGFYDLLCDAIFQHRLAADCSNSYRMNRHARASISASSLALECAANCLLEEVDVSAAFVDDLDKLPVISKFDACLRLSGGKALDRGRAEVQKVVELMKVRNEFVHTKTKSIRSEVGPLANQGPEVCLPVSFDGEMWPALNIPKRPVFWVAESAFAVLSAIVVFLRYALVDLKGLSPEEIRNILVSRVELGNITIPMQFEEFLSELSSITSYGLDLAFLGCPNDVAKRAT